MRKLYCYAILSVLLGSAAAFAEERMLSVPIVVKLGSFTLNNSANGGNFAYQVSDLLARLSTAQVRLSADIQALPQENWLGHTHIIHPEMKVYGNISSGVTLREATMLYDLCKFMQSMFSLMSTDDYYLEGNCVDPASTEESVFRKKFEASVTPR